MSFKCQSYSCQNGTNNNCNIIPTQKPAPTLPVNTCNLKNKTCNNKHRRHSRSRSRSRSRSCSPDRCYDICSWPPCIDNGLNNIFVPGTFATLDEALAHLHKVDKSQDYYIYLKPKGNYHILKEGTLGVESVTFYGDKNLPVGVYYGHKCAIQSISEDYTYNTDNLINGLGPYEVQLNGNKLVVTGYMNPNFSNVKIGSKIAFYHLDNIITYHCITYACKNVISVEEPIDINECSRDHHGCECDCNKNSCCPKFINQGQGFYIIPSVSISIPNKINLNASDGQFTFKGLCINASNSNFVNKSSTDSIFLHNCVLSGNIHLTCSNLSAENPNVLQGNFYLDHMSGEVHNMSIIDTGAVYCNSTNHLKFLTSDVIDCCGFFLTNSADATLQNSFAYKNNKAVCLSQGCSLNTSGSMYLCNCTAITAVSANITAGANDGFENYHVTFCANKTCVNGSSYNCKFAADKCIMVNNDLCFTNNKISEIDIQELVIDDNITFRLVDGVAYTAYDPEVNINHIYAVNNINDLS